MTDDGSDITTQNPISNADGSRRSYYSEYRDKARRLDRAIDAIASVGAQLVNTINGVGPLASAVVRVAAQYFDADRAVLIMNRQVYQHWVAQRRHNAIVVRADDDLPPDLHNAVRKALDLQQLVVASADDGTPLLAAPMTMTEDSVGVLAVMPPAHWQPDEREILVLQTLAHQAAVALGNALLYEEATRQKDELARANQQLQRADRSLQQARQNAIVNDERNRIARELHDSVAQHLLSIGMNLEWCRAQLPPDSPVYDRINATKELARSAVERIRGAIFELSTIAIAEAGLIAALQKLIAEFEGATRLPVELRVVGKTRSLPADVEQALYGIAQEALFNAYKHAQSRQIVVTLRWTARAVLLSVADDGIGISDEAARRGSDRRSGHYGLRNMRLRAHEVGGRCTIGRGRGGGTVVRVRAET
jgi:signal transduction histidine kinase